jgi:predicted outer membrane repeat protein
MINSIIWSNYCEEDVASVYNWNECNTRIDYSIVEGGYVGEGILDADPLFVDPENNNFNLQEGSIALTASNNGSKIGYDASVKENRSVSDYDSIIDSLHTIEGNEEPTVIDLSNAKLNEDVSFVGDTIYVTTNGNGNGENWANSMASLQDAIDYANAKYVSTGLSVNIFIAEGTYYTGEERSNSFILREGVYLYGGFDATETSLDDRNYKKNKTILSGDIGVRDEATDNSYHVVIGSNNAILDGLIITGGYADKKDDGEVYDNKGGGLLNYYAGNRVVPHYTPVLGFDTIVRNSVFEDNYAEEGAASYTFHGGNPVFENCAFENNEAMYGGAILDRAGTNSTYVNSKFENNVAQYKGGAAFIDYGSMATFTDCEFDKNTSGTAGGAIYVIDRASQAITNDTDFDLIDPTWSTLDDIFSTVLVVNSEFTNNTAGSNGGSLYVYEGSFAKVINTIFSGNDAAKNGDDIGIFYESTLYLDGDSEFDSLTSDTIYIEDGSTLINE